MAVTVALTNRLMQYFWGKIQIFRKGSKVILKCKNKYFFGKYWRVQNTVLACAALWRQKSKINSYIMKQTFSCFTVEQFFFFTDYKRAESTPTSWSKHLAVMHLNRMTFLFLITIKQLYHFHNCQYMHFKTWLPLWLKPFIDLTTRL